MSLEQRRLRKVAKNVGKGWTKFLDPPVENIAVYQLALTASEDCQVTFGGPGAAATPTFSLLKGVPLVLPSTSDGWWEFDGAADVGVLVATPAATIDVGILAMVKLS